MNKELKAYLLSDRQWTHPMRVAHAKFMLEQADDSSEKKFWQAVLDANDKGEENGNKS